MKKFDLVRRLAFLLCLLVSLAPAAEAQGLIGNLPFWNEVVVLDLGERPAFGILR